MEYTWLGKQAEVIIEEKDMGEHDVCVHVDGRVIKVAEMAQRVSGNYVAMADGYLYDGETKEVAAQKAVDVKHEQAEARIIAAERVNESAAARKKRLAKDKERQKAFK